MEPNPLSIIDIATVLYCNIDDDLEYPEHEQAKLSVSELVTIGVMFALKGGSFRRFHKWVQGNLMGCFPTLPERSRLQRRLIQYQQLVKDFLAQPSFFCIADSYGVELRHPIREFHTPKTSRIGGKGKSNKRWIHGMKVLVVINDQGEVVSFAIALAGQADKVFNTLLSSYNQQTIILVDLGFRDKNGVPECLKLCQHKTWSERMTIEQLFSQLTRYLGTKKRHHRTEQGFQAFWSYLVIALNVIAAIPDLMLAQVIL
jgi:Transposase DDE domain